MAPRVATAYTHVVDEQGEGVMLRPGQEIPARLERFVTNPDAYVDIEAEDVPTAPQEPAVITVPVSLNGIVTEVEAIVESDEDGNPLVVRIDGEDKHLADLPGYEPPVEPTEPETDPVTPAEPTEPVTPAEPTEPVTPAEPTEPVTPAEPTEPAEKPLDDMSYEELQEAAKRRDVPANGKRDVLLARIKAFDAGETAE